MKVTTSVRAWHYGAGSYTPTPTQHTLHNCGGMCVRYTLVKKIECHSVARLVMKLR